jgi:hypothetical protein
MVAGQPLPLSILLRTGNFHGARIVSVRPSVVVDGLRMAYGPFTGMSRGQMTQVFGDAFALAAATDRTGSGR